MRTQPAITVHVSACRGGGNFISHLLTAVNLPATSNFHFNVCPADLESDILNCARGGERATVATCLCVTLDLLIRTYVPCLLSVEESSTR